MYTKKIPLASDNWAPAHPDILKAILSANEGAVPSYGADSWSIEAQRSIQDAFKRECRIFFVPSGTAANVLGLKIACKRYESIICSDIAHINYQESGALESVTGCKLLTIPAIGGKVSPQAISKALQRERTFGKHSTKPRVLSITQPTEVGTVYSLAELRALASLCREEGLLMHIDGSRLYNAAVAMKVDLREIIDEANPDLLSLGGTKNGLINAEAVIIFNPILFEGSDHLHKQTLALVSKTRYMAAQFIPFIRDNLWLALATNANSKAREIGALILGIPELKLSYPLETNQIFFTAPSEWIARIQEHVNCYIWDHDKGEIRFITSWNTSDDDIREMKMLLNAISAVENQN